MTPMNSLIKSVSLSTHEQPENNSLPHEAFFGVAGGRPAGRRGGRLRSPNAATDRPADQSKSDCWGREELLSKGYELMFFES